MCIILKLNIIVIKITIYITCKIHIVEHENKFKKCPKLTETVLHQKIIDTILCAILSDQIISFADSLLYI